MSAQGGHRAERHRRAGRVTTLSGMRDELPESIGVGYRCRSSRVVYRSGIKRIKRATVHKTIIPMPIILRFLHILPQLPLFCPHYTNDNRSNDAEEKINPK